MTFFQKVASFGQAVQASEDVESIVKVAAESDVSRNDLIVLHNLTVGNVYTGEDIVKVAEDEADSILLVAVSAYEKVASGEIDEAQAISMVEEAGLVADDLYDVAGLIDKQASEAGVVADQDVWEKVAEAHEFLVEAGLDPVASMEFAETYSAAEDGEAQDKVASEFDGLDEESFDKIAEAHEFLSDIEGVSLTDLMDEYDKEAGSKVDAAKKALNSVKDDLSGEKSKRVAKSMKSGLWNKKSKEDVGMKSFGVYSQKNLKGKQKAVENRKHLARGGAAVAALGATGAAAGSMSKEASEAFQAEDAVWEKVAEAHEFLVEAGLDPVNSMEFAETFSAAEDEEAQDKVASEFDGLDEESIDKIAEAHEFLSDIEGISLTDLMGEIEKEAGSKVDAVKKGLKRAKDDFTGANAKAVDKSMKSGLWNKKSKEAAGVKSFKGYSNKTLKGKQKAVHTRKNLTRAGVVAGGTAVAATGADATFNGRG